MGAHELTLAECEQWAHELGYDRDWKRLLHDAGLGAKITNRDNIKSKWRLPDPLPTQRKIRAALDRTEAKRREPTQMGTVIRGLEDWQNLGDQLAARPTLFLSVKAHVEGVLADLKAASTAEQAKAKIEAIESGLTPFEPPAEPKPSEDRRSNVRRDSTPDRQARRIRSH